MLQITPWERILLRLVAKDESTSDIAARFDMSEGDLEAHLSRLFGRMGVSNRQEASEDARRRGLLTSPSMTAESSSEALIARVSALMRELAATP